MGNDIAEIFAVARLIATLSGVRKDTPTRGGATLTSSRGWLLSKDKLDIAARNALLARIEVSADFSVSAMTVRHPEADNRKLQLNDRAGSVSGDRVGQ